MANARYIPGSSWRYLGYHQMTVSTTVVDLTDSAAFTIPTTAVEVRLQPETGNLRYMHSSDVTASTGNVIYAGDVEVVGPVLSDIQLVRKDGTDVTLNCSYYGFWKF